MNLRIQKLLIMALLVFITAQACVLTSFFPRPMDEIQPAIETTRESIVLTPKVPTRAPTSMPSATETVQSAPEPEPAVFIDILPIDLGDGQVLLWAGGALASSSANREPYHFKQALGKPNTHACGRFVTAWQPAPEETEAWIELYFAPYILPDHLSIHQSYLPGQLSKVEVVTLDEEIITVFDRAVDEIYQPDDCPATRGFWLQEVEVLISTVRITLERQVDEAWMQIDAVGIEGLIGDGPTEPMVIEEWVEDEFGDDYGDFYTPRYYSNKNRINALTFAGDQLWTASDGGVVAWDLDFLNPKPYTAAQGMPTNATTAITYCDWEPGKIVTGGVGGMAIFDGYYEFFKIEHPNDETLGMVTALACDPEREQIWAGYLGHLSRYDLATQTWTEFGANDGMPMDVVRQIKIINQDVWVATAFGVAVVRDGNRLSAYTPDNSEIPSKFVHAIAADRAGVMWMASSNGLIEFDGQAWTLWKSSEISGGPLLDFMMGLDTDQAGNLWVVDAYGILCQFDPAMRKCLQILEPPDNLGGITAFQVDSQGRMALGDFRDGVRFVLDDEWFVLRTRDKLLDNVIHAIAYAPDGNLWLAGRGGVQYFQADQPASPWQHMPLPDNAQPHAFFVASDGLWIGHTNGARFLPYLEEEPVDLSIGDPDTIVDNTVMAISVDQNGLVYFGTYGLSIWDGSDFLYEDLLSDAERERNVYPPRVNALFADGDVVWVGASNGLYQFKQGHLIESWGEILLSLTGYTSSVGVVAPSPDGNGLLVAVGNDLYRFDMNKFEFVLELESEIRSIYAMPYALMLATGNSGIYSLPMDSIGIYWDQVSGWGGFARQFGYQAITMSDGHTLWIGSWEGGLQRSQALFGQ